MNPTVNLYYCFTSGYSLWIVIIIVVAFTVPSKRYYPARKDLSPE